MKIRDIMTTEVSTAEPDTTLEEIATIMKEEDVGAVPVIDGDELIGIVTDRDIVLRCIAEGKDASEVHAEDILTDDLHTISPEDDVQEASRIMAERQIRRLPVVEQGTLIGMVSIGDIAVKQGSDELSGDTLQDVSRGVKNAKQSGRSASGSQKARAEIRGPRSAGTVQETSGRAGNLRQQGLRQHKDSGNTGRSSGERKISRSGSDREETVVPIRDTGRSRRKAS